MKNRRYFLIVLAVLALSVIACQLSAAPSAPAAQAPAPTEVPLPTQPAATAAPSAVEPAPVTPTVPVDKEERADGWTVYRMTEEKFVVSLPPKWQKIDMDPETMKSSLQTVSEKNPAFAKVLSEQIQNMAAQGIKFYGMDLSLENVGTGFVNNVNIMRQDLNADVSLDLVRQINVGQLEQMENVIKPVNNTIVDLPAGKAIQLNYQMGIASADGSPVKVSIVQYMIVKDRQLFVITAGAIENMAAKYTPLFEQIGQEFQILP